MSDKVGIRAALDNWLDTMTQTWPIAWPNRGYEPVVGTAFMRATVLPAESVQADLGEQGKNYEHGIYQIDVFSPAGVGVGSAETQIKLVAARFARGTTVTHGDVTVRILSLSLSLALEEPDWFHNILEARYYGFLSN